MDIYDRNGMPIGMDEFTRLLSNPGYNRVAEDEVGVYWVSTVWLGLDHNFGLGGLPLIFETMVFAPDEDAFGPELECRRYSTEAEALEGHAEQVLLVRATTQEEPVMDEKERKAR